MRTTLSIDDDVLSAAKEMAAAQDNSRGGHIFTCQARIESTRIPAKDAEWRSPVAAACRYSTRDIRTGASVARGTGLKRFLIDINVLIALIDPAHYLLALARAHGGQLATFDHRLVADAVVNGAHALHLIR